MDEGTEFENVTIAAVYDVVHLLYKIYPGISYYTGWNMSFDTSYNIRNTKLQIVFNGRLWDS